MVSIKKLSIGLLCFMAGQSILLFGMEKNNGWLYFNWFLNKEKSNAHWLISTTIPKPISTIYSSHGVIFMPTCIHEKRLMQYPSITSARFVKGEGLDIKYLESAFGKTKIKNGIPVVNLFAWLNKHDNEKFLKTHPQYPRYIKILSKLQKYFVIKPTPMEEALRIVKYDVENLGYEEKKIYNEISSRKIPKFFPFPLVIGKENGKSFTTKIFDVFVNLKYVSRKQCPKDPSTTIPFHVTLQKAQKYFVKKPRWVLGEQNKLVQEGILVRKEGRLYHGPNGFLQIIKS